MIKTKDLTVLHPTGQEILDINLSVDKGEVVSIIGSNSSGKSLLARVIADPAIEHKGEVVLSHTNRRNDPEKAVIQLGYAPTEPVFEKYLSGYEQLDFLGSIFGLNTEQRAKEIIRLCQTFNFSAPVYQLIESLNLADRKILSLIASLVHQPNSVVWDEPTSHLDPTQIGLVKQAIAELKNNKTAILIVTNDLLLAEEISDEIAVMVNGAIKLQGNLKQLKSQTGAKNNSLEEIYQLATAQNG